MNSPELGKELMSLKFMSNQSAGQPQEVFFDQDGDQVMKMAVANLQDGHWKRVGYFDPRDESFAIKTRISWPRTGTATPKDITICPAAHYVKMQENTTHKCIKCEPGFYSDQPSSALQCDPCPAGEFASDSGMNRCMQCKILGNTYQPLSGQTACHDCPERTQLFLGQTTDVTDCICGSGSWRPDGMRGQACLKCPVGAVRSLIKNTLPH